VSVAGEVSVTARAIPAGVAFPREPVRLGPLVLPGGLGEHKWIDRRLVDDAAADGGEALIVDLDGTVLETGRGSIWIVEGDAIVTPPADGRILPGVTRDVVIEAADATVEEISLERLRAADDVFVTSAIRGVQRAFLAGSRAAGEPAPAVERVTALLRQLVSRQTGPRRLTA
jgi:para-aminobenzoate synthetase/4-amino-4-deoxychorismate lyase